ncbi:ABC transporter permease [Leifsonia sp. LS1]|uniref:amino acid ABC transporter permease n=1 Tax=Leifsonia sp. LS1 TaxID=2828483 RepID=UPI001CFCFC26|nr:amino acid ABC transporter permease [Leifsonia sp. LS1]GIT82050.1 ABC transporter permease [Leifsonia sp. LS1]
MTTLEKERTIMAVDPEFDIKYASRRRHPWRWVSAIIILIFVADFVRNLVTNPNFGWPVVFSALRAESIIKGLGVTLLLTVIAMIIGIVLGVLLAIARLSPNPVLRSAAGTYVWFFRGTPTLVQLIFFYNLSALFPHLSIGLPFGGPQFATFDTNAVITPLFAAILGLGLNEGAYMSEIVRGGLLSVDAGQQDAAHALGMTDARVMRRIVLPQAMRFIIPPTGNQVISMLKATALVSVIALSDLLYAAQSIYNRTFETIPLLIVVCIWYLAITSVLYVGQSFIERRFSRSDRRARTTYRDFLRIRPKATTPPVTEGPTA